MTKREKKNSATRSGAKLSYASPRLEVHGNVRELTRAKGERKSDGAGKPATRLNAGPA